MRISRLQACRVWEDKPSSLQSGDCVFCLVCCPCACADLVNVFEVFLPQLLLYPNPTDPLNGEAAALLMREPAAYNQRVKGECEPAARQPVCWLAPFSVGLQARLCNAAEG